jgi:hypothetical protein
VLAGFDVDGENFLTTRADIDQREREERERDRREVERGGGRREMYGRNWVAQVVGERKER